MFWLCELKWARSVRARSMRLYVGYVACSMCASVVCAELPGYMPPPTTTKGVSDGCPQFGRLRPGSRRSWPYGATWVQRGKVNGVRWGAFEGRTALMAMSFPLLLHGCHRCGLWRFPFPCHVDVALHRIDGLPDLLGAVPFEQELFRPLAFAHKVAALQARDRLLAD